MLILQVDREERPDVDKVYNIDTLIFHLVCIFGSMSAKSTYEDIVSKMVFKNYPKFLWNLNLRVSQGNRAY